MNIHEKLDFFRQLILCNHELPLRSYDPSFLLASPAASPHALEDNDMLVLISLEEPLKKYVESRSRRPVLIDDIWG